jgi:DNA-binding response OmpR family regulator
MPQAQLRTREPRLDLKPIDSRPTSSWRAGARIVVCNRNSPLLDLFSEILEDDGFEVITCDRGERIQHTIGVVQPDLIILDFWVGRVSAREIVDRLRTSGSPASVPVLICSVDPPKFHQATEWLEASGCALLPMPFEIDRLLETARRLTGTHRTVEPLPHAFADLR